MVFLYQIEAWSKLAEAAGARYAIGFPCLVLSAYSNAWLKRMLEPNRQTAGRQWTQAGVIQFMGLPLYCSRRLLPCVPEDLRN